MSESVQHIIADEQILRELDQDLEALIALGYLAMEPDLRGKLRFHIRESVEATDAAL